MESKIIDIIPVRKYKKFSGIEQKKNLVILEKQGFKCNNCSATALELFIIYYPETCTFDKYINAINSSGQEVRMTLDHIIPKSKGGKDNHSNLQILCEQCNSKKADKIMEGVTNEKNNFNII